MLNSIFEMFVSFCLVKNCAQCCSSNPRCFCDDHTVVGAGGPALEPHSSSSDEMSDGDSGTPGLLLGLQQ